MEPAVSAEALVKTYYSTKKAPGFAGALKQIFKPERVGIEAVKGINLRLDQGEIVGFLGPNGAGKTTTLKMLTGILYPTSGECRVLGFEPQKRQPALLKQISLVMGNKQQLWWDLPAWDSFVVLRELYEVDHAVFKQRTDFLIDALDLKDKVNTQVRKLSLGERMKCELVAALLHGPKVLFLDEPTLGLDVVSQKRIRDFLKDLHAQEGNTILLTSHYMQDVEELCQRIVIIDHGVVVYEGTLDALSAKFSGTKKLQLTFEGKVAAADLAKYSTKVSVEENVATLEVARADTAAVTAAVLSNFPVSDVAISDPDIEEVIRELFSGVSRETSAQ